MSKDTYYFPHDINAFLDPKIRLIVAEYGIMSYGVFWIIVEMLASQKDYKIPVTNFIKSLKPLLQGKNIEPESDDGFCDYKDDDGIKIPLELVGCHRIELAYATGIFQKMIDVGLFKTDGKYFWSHSLLERMENREIKSQKQRENALKRWHPEPNPDIPNATALPEALPVVEPPFNNGNAQEKRREEKTREEEDNKISSLKEEDKKEKLSSSSLKEELNIYEIYSREIGELTATISDQLKDAEQQYTAEWVTQAIKQAVLQNKMRLSYILGTLKKCKEEGHPPLYKKNGKTPIDKTDPNYYKKGKYGKVVQS